METLTTTTASTDDQLAAIAINTIIAKVVFVVEQGYDKWRGYEIAKAAIADFATSADEYERAIRKLADELGV